MKVMNWLKRRVGRESSVMSGEGLLDRVRKELKKNLELLERLDKQERFVIDQRSWLIEAGIKLAGMEKEIVAWLYKIQREVDGN